MVETTNGGGALHAAIAHLESAERQLSQHLAATRQALVSLRSVSGTEVAPLPKPERKAKPTAKANGRGFVSDEAVRAALKDGPSSPSDLAERLSR